MWTQEQKQTLADIRTKPRRTQKPILPDLTALGYLQSIYQDPNQDQSVRMRAAIYALPMESPKLQAIAVTPMSNDLAAMLDRAIAASERVKAERAGRLIEAKANPPSDEV